MIHPSTIRARLARVGMLEATIAICRRQGVSFTAVWSGSRERPLPYVRALIYGMLRRSLLWSYPEIAGLVGAPDHFAVWWGVTSFKPAAADIRERRRRARLRRVENTVRRLRAQNKRAA